MEFALYIGRLNPPHPNVTPRASCTGQSVICRPSPPLLSKEPWDPRFAMVQRKQRRTTTSTTNLVVARWERLGNEMVQ